MVYITNNNIKIYSNLEICTQTSVIINTCLCQFHIKSPQCQWGATGSLRKKQRTHKPFIVTQSIRKRTEIHYSALYLHFNISKIWFRLIQLTNALRISEKAWPFLISKQKWIVLPHFKTSECECFIHMCHVKDDF